MELKFGSWAYVWNEGEGKRKRIYLGYAHGKHWAVTATGETYFQGAVEVMITPWDYAEPCPEIDWTKVPQNTPVLVRDSDDDRWIKAYFACYAPKSPFPFHVFRNNGRYVEGKDASSVVSYVYAMLDADIIPEEWRAKDEV